MRMKRHVTKRLESWKNSENKKPLIIKGARQVGKTYTIREFAKNNYDHLVEINFERDYEFVNLFNQTRKPSEILSYLRLTYMDVPLDKGTLLFLDEIQACSQALTSLKFLSEEFPCDIICSGSMLGVAIASTSSFPVGYVETWDMYPMTFMEFIEALGVPSDTIEMIDTHIKNRTPLPEVIHQKMNEIFLSYVIVGGMPEAVSKYVQTKSYADSLLVQRRIVSDYLNDIAKYALGADRIKARECFESIPLQLAKDNKKFQYKLIKNGGSARHYEGSLKWLEDSGLIIPVYRLKNIDLPLEVYRELSVFKVYFCDTGLLVSQLNDGAIKALSLGDLGVYKGAIYENIAAQILREANKKAYYFEPSTTSEIDFIVYYEGEMTPLEIKAGMNTKSTSFNHFVEKYQPKYSYRLSQKNISEQSMPLYALEFIINQENSLF